MGPIGHSQTTMMKMLKRKVMRDLLMIRMMKKWNLKKPKV